LRRAAPAALVALAGIFAGAVGTRAAPADVHVVPEPPAVVIAKYVAALASVPAPKYVRFEYSVEQVGPRDLVQTHRIYRSGQTERDETLSVDGQTLPNPSVRIIRHRVDRYGIAAVAPRPVSYVFTFVGSKRSGARYDYAFATQPRSSGASFTVTGVLIDGRRHLPLQIAFEAGAKQVRATGRLTYAPFEHYWMIVEATVTARSEGKVSRERIAWSRYSFLDSLPESTFVAPRPLPTTNP
jgi:hypothetical protein